MVSMDNIFETLHQQGSERYGSERVSQLDHALQCAWLAERADKSPALITAALLHDVGHLIHKFGDDAALRGIDDRHEVLGAKFLARLFGDDVTQPIALHVDAKRYLCTNEPGYYEILSPGSVRSLHLQGGLMTEHESEAFRNTGFYAAAVDLRRWDEQAKIPELRTPGLDYFRKYAEACMIQSEEDDSHAASLAYGG